MSVLNKQSKYIFILFASLLMMSCNKEYTVEFSVENSSERKLQVIFQRPNELQIDSNQINRGQQLIFLVEMGEGEKAESYINGLSELPLDFLEISDLNQNQLSCEPIKMECWKQSSFGSKGELGTISLRVVESSFE